MNLYLNLNAHLFLEAFFLYFIFYLSYFLLSSFLFTLFRRFLFIHHYFILSFFIISFILSYFLSRFLYHFCKHSFHQQSPTISNNLQILPLILAIFFYHQNQMPLFCLSLNSVKQKLSISSDTKSVSLS